MPDSVARKTVMIAAGGTGGHVFPALAVAQGLRQHDLDIIWLGTRKGIESRVVPENDFVIHYIKVAGIRGKNIISWITAPLLLLWAIVKVAILIIKTKPVCVLGMGGFASAAAGFAAFITGTPLLLQEQNAVAGTTNKLLAPLAEKIFTGFPDVFSALAKADSKVEFSGNPLREGLYQIAEPQDRIKQDDSPLRVLILGGSLGARALNQVMPFALAQQSMAIEITHQTGRSDIEQVQKNYLDAGVDAQVISFIEDMATAYANADLVVARAGALTVSELAAVGVAAVLIPYPYAIDDHQSVNADYLVQAGAATKVDQAEFDIDKAREVLQTLLGDRAQLLTKAINARSFATPAATRTIVDVCREYAYV